MQEITATETKISAVKKSLAKLERDVTLLKERCQIFISKGDNADDLMQRIKELAAGYRLKREELNTLNDQLFKLRAKHTAALAN